MTHSNHYNSHANALIVLFRGLVLALFLSAASSTKGQYSWQDTYTLYTPVSIALDTYYTKAHVSFGKNLFAVTTDANLYSSSDGINWARRYSVSSNEKLAGVAFGNEYFVALNPWHYLTPGGTVYVRDVLISYDGISWQRKSAVNAPDNIDYRYGNFYGTRNSGADFMISTDGINWVQQNNAKKGYLSDSVNGLYYYGEDDKYYTSPNWDAWTEHSWNIWIDGSHYGISRVFYVKNRYVYIGVVREPVPVLAYEFGIYFVSSVDGVVLTQPSYLISPYGKSSAGQANKILQVNKVLVVAGGAANYGNILTSEDGLTFTERIGGGFGYRVNDMAYGNNTFVAVGNKILTSFVPLTLTPTNGNQGSEAGSGSLSVTAAAGSSWSAIANQSWIHTSSSGSGNGTVNYTIDANTSESSRAGTITVQGQTFTITQAGAVFTPSITSPAPGSTLISSSVTFQWSSGTGVTNYLLEVGRSARTYGIYRQNQGLNLSATVTGLPTDGSTVYVRLWWATPTAASNYTNYTYTAYYVAPTRFMSLSGNLAFGNVTVGSSAQRTLTIANNGNSTLTVSDISYPSGFSGNWSGAIAASGSQPVTVTFSPTSASSYNGTVTVTSDKTGGTNINTISGTGTQPILGAARQNSNIVLGWPANLTGYTLMSSTNLGTAADWNAVSLAPVVVSGQNVVTNPMNAQRKFYRLTHP